MVIPGTRTTGPLTTRMAACEEAPGWRVEAVDSAHRDAAGELASYRCDCNDLTLAQITRAGSSSPQFAIVVTCPRDGTRNERSYRLTPWTVDDFVVNRSDWRCNRCDEPVAVARLFDGVIAGLEIDCPICGSAHSIDLSLSALPAELRQRVFGIPQPLPILSPPVVRLLHDMWKCVQDAPETNSFVYVAHTVRYDSGRIVHSGSQHALSTEASYLEQLAAAGLIDDGDQITISDRGIDHCRQEFGPGAG